MHFKCLIFKRSVANKLWATVQCSQAVSECKWLVYWLRGGWCIMWVVVGGKGDWVFAHTTPTTVLVNEKQLKFQIKSNESKHI